MSDAELARRASAGDRAAFAALVAAHRGAVFGFARRLTRDPSQAADVMQETFLAALARLPGWRGEGSLRGWLLAIARTQALLARRRRAGEPADFEQVESLPELGLEAGWGAALDPQALAERVEARSALERALDRLPDDAREVLLLRDVEGLSGDETAAALGLSVAAMKSRLHRARLQLLAAVKRGGLHGE